MINKEVIKLLKLLTSLIFVLFLVKMILPSFTSVEQIKEKNKNEIYEKYMRNISNMRDSMFLINEKLTYLNRNMTIEHRHFYKNVYDTTYSREFKNTNIYSYWFYSYGDSKYQGYNVIKFEGNSFNFDKAMKIYHSNGKAEQFGGINSIKRITYEEYITANEERRK